MPAELVALLVQVVELVAEVAPHIVTAIQSHGDYTEEQRANLIARVNAARAKVAAYEPKDV